MLFFGKKDDSNTIKAINFCKNFDEVNVYLGEWGDPFPNVKADKLVVSYLSRWIIPSEFLEHVDLAINFHPASPEYPGYGCINFALYNNASEYGVTCHHMVTKVDTGPIIAVKRFPIYGHDTVKTLLSRTYDYQIILFYEVMDLIFNGIIPISKETWGREPYTKRDFNKLNVISEHMDKSEIERRVRAFSFKNWQPVVI